MFNFTLSSTSISKPALLSLPTVQIKDGYVTVTLKRTGATVRQVAELVLIKLGLSGSVLIEFNVWYGSDILESAVNQLTQQGISNYFNQENVSIISINITIKASLIQQLQEFGLIFTQSSNGEFSPAGRTPKSTRINNIAQMSAEDKLTEAIKRAIPMLPSEAQEQLKALLTPEALAIAVGTLVIWAGSHFFGVGEFVDVILLIVGVAFVGLGVFEGAAHFYDFVTIAINAKSDSELTKSAEHFAEAVTVLGITAITAILMKNSAKAVVKRGIPKYRPLANIAPPPPNGTKIITRPAKLRDGVLGSTDLYGYIQVTRRGSINEQRVTLYHEWIHRILSPRVAFLRRFRAQIKWSGYQKSAFLRYLEEALAETFGNYRVYGIQKSIVGITFPIDAGYMTISQLTAEGIAIGNIYVGGLRFSVYIGYGNITPELR